MAPTEKLGDAITVKTPLPPLGPSKEKNEKKLLSDKKTARKTTSSKPKQNPSVTRTSDAGSSLERTSTSDAAPLDQRPLKKPRLSHDADKSGLGSRHHVSSFADSVSRLSPVFNPANTEERSRESVASDFALRPKKENPNPLEMVPRPNQRENQIPSIVKSLHNPQLPKQQGLRNNVRNYVIPTHGVIDLTQDDEPWPRFPSNGRQGSYADTRKDRDRPTAEPDARVGQGISDLPRGGKSIEVQTTSNPGTAKSNGNVEASNRDGQNYVRRTDPNLAPDLPPPKTNGNIHIAPQPAKSSSSPGTPLGPQPFQPKFNNDKQKAPQCHQNSQPAPPDPQRQDGTQNDTQARQPVPIEKPATFSFTVDSRTSTMPAVPGPFIASNQPGMNGYHPGSIFTSSAQTNNVVHEIIERSTAAQTTKVNGAPSPSDNKASNLNAPLPRPEPVDAASRKRRSQSRESNRSKIQSIPKSNSHTLSESSHNTDLKKPSQIELANGTNNHKAENPVTAPVVKPSLGSMIRDQSWRSSNIEKKRQILISKHDPEKFDSYIYSKNNEPFRPGSALFGLPPWKQPARPTRPAMHYAHIDPRIHWSHPRSETWHRKKQREIYERGNRKDNYGQAAARAAKRKREDSHPTTSLPERVKSNPKWLAALDELDEMAEIYHAQKRAKFKGRKERKERGELKNNTGRQEKEKETIPVDEDGDCEMTDNPFDQRSALNSPKTNISNHVQLPYSTIWNG
ncbi:uncharacterized protein GGS22DRAFT_188143 [Annulohypoxylon maeteangense]|uniref:uncharacterized protein n=1 Tax=Annulohypoxylon maeteangense TaxID=1927788 RepID=UPI0020088FEB|nr:uncharacterized protein GGS22DRAFT_188143 [Annulohypoxylon maeteangense]KAI0885855.1 hypothetical protein GGS22DRAFT_188143 [Annulohypoxylon maeteangense]